MSPGALRYMLARLRAAAMSFGRQSSVATPTGDTLTIYNGPNGLSVKNSAGQVMSISLDDSGVPVGVLAYTQTDSSIGPKWERLNAMPLFVSEYPTLATLLEPEAQTWNSVYKTHNGIAVETANNVWYRGSSIGSLTISLAGDGLQQSTGLNMTAITPVVSQGGFRRVVAFNNRTYFSTQAGVLVDDGTSWSWLHIGGTRVTQTLCFAIGPRLFVIANNGSTSVAMWSSPDGVTWDPVTIPSVVLNPSTSSIINVWVHPSGTFATMWNRNSNQWYAYTVDGGVTWTGSGAALGTTPNGGVSTLDGTTWIIALSNSASGVRRTTNHSTFTNCTTGIATSPSSTPLSGVINGRFVLLFREVGATCITTSPDGTTWTAISIPSGRVCVNSLDNPIFFFNNQWYVHTDVGETLVSSSITSPTWVDLGSGVTNGRAVLCDGTVYISEHGPVATRTIKSYDGTTFSAAVTLPTGLTRALPFISNQWIKAQ